MTDISFKNWDSMTDKVLAEHIGIFIKYHRLEHNKTQGAVANTAGISRSTLSQLERGETVTVASLIRVLRVLDQLHVMEVFGVQQEISPLALAKMERNKRKRASGKNEENTNK